MTSLLPSDYAIDSFMYLTAGPGAAVSLAYNITPKFALYASIHGYYGMFEFFNASDYYKNSLSITPSAGLRIRIR